jgi:hypothetical protein
MDTIISLLVDTWIVLNDPAQSGETNRTLMGRKSRGMCHTMRIPVKMIG